MKLTVVYPWLFATPYSQLKLIVLDLPSSAAPHTCVEISCPVAASFFCAFFSTFYFILFIYLFFCPVQSLSGFAISSMGSTFVMIMPVEKENGCPNLAVNTAVKNGKHVLCNPTLEMCVGLGGGGCLLSFWHRKVTRLEHSARSTDWRVIELSICASTSQKLRL